MIWTSFLVLVRGNDSWNLSKNFRYTLYKVLMLSSDISFNPCFMWTSFLVLVRGNDSWNLSKNCRYTLYKVLMLSSDISFKQCFMWTSFHVLVRGNDSRNLSKNCRYTLYKLLMLFSGISLKTCFMYVGKFISFFFLQLQDRICSSRLYIVPASCNRRATDYVPYVIYVIWQRRRVPYRLFALNTNYWWSQYVISDGTTS